MSDTQATPTKTREELLREIRALAGRPGPPFITDTELAYLLALIEELKQATANHGDVRLG